MVRGRQKASQATAAASPHMTQIVESLSIFPTQAFLSAVLLCVYHFTSELSQSCWENILCFFARKQQLNCRLVSVYASLFFLFHSLNVLVFLWEYKRRRKKFSTPKLSLRQSVVIFSASFSRPFLAHWLSFYEWDRMPCWNLNVRFFQLPSKIRAICLLTVIFLKKVAE